VAYLQLIVRALVNYLTRQRSF